MKIVTYASAARFGKYLSVPAGTDFAKTPFPSTLDQDLRKVFPLPGGSQDFQPGDTRLLDSDDIIRQITEKGYATHTANITVSFGSRF